ncbi:MAG: hypothetical protein SFV21_00305 [Rhodospirillaceae bacterium]|nr:hypothetical protein [Rhodospirillaceae bacterium]
MATAIRESILANVYAALKGIGQVRAFRNLTSRPTEIPCLVLFDSPETAEPAAPPLHQVEMDLDIEAWTAARTEDELGPALNALLLKTSAALFADVTRGGLAIDTRYAGVAQPVLDKTAGGTPLIGAIFTFKITYWTADADLSAAI